MVSAPVLTPHGSLTLGQAEEALALAPDQGARLEQAFARHRGGGFFSEYPFGTDLTADEVVLARALKLLQARTATRAGKARTLLSALVSGQPPEQHRALLKRMRLDTPATFGERMLQRLVSQALRDA